MQEDVKNFPSHTIINVDECCLFVDVDKKKVLVERNLRKVSTCAKALGTYVPFISANGDVICSFYVYRGRTSKDGKTKVFLPPLDSREKTKRRNWPQFHIVSETGYVNTETWSVIMKEFCNTWNLRFPGI